MKLGQICDKYFQSGIEYRFEGIFIPTESL